MTIGFLQPEMVGGKYKPVSFGGNEPFRIHIPVFLENALSVLPRHLLAGVPRSLAVISIFVVMWDYKWLHIQQMPGSQVEGLREYRELQLIVLLIRFAAWGVTRYVMDAVLIAWISSFLGTLSLIVFAN